MADATLLLALASGVHRDASGSRGSHSSRRSGARMTADGILQRRTAVQLMRYRSYSWMMVLLLDDGSTPG